MSRAHAHRLARLEDRSPVKLAAMCEAMADRILGALPDLNAADGLDEPAPDRATILAGIRRAHGLEANADA